MNWSKYAEKKGKTADFAKKEREISAAKKEINLIIKQFPKIAECLEYVDKVEGYY